MNLARQPSVVAQDGCESEQHVAHQGDEGETRHLHAAPGFRGGFLVWISVKRYAVRSQSLRP
jgi:hypothetical protein